MVLLFINQVLYQNYIKFTQPGMWIRIDSIWIQVNKIPKLISKHLIKVKKKKNQVLEISSHQENVGDDDVLRFRLENYNLL